MGTRKMLAFEIAVIALVAMPLRAQEKSKPRDPGAPLLVQVVFNEYEGEKKLSTLPYAIPVNADTRETSLRMGIRVPINVGGAQGQESKVVYQDVGTDIDCSAEPLEGERFRVHLRTGRSSIYHPGGVRQSKTGPAISMEQPLFSHFSTSLNLLMRDGQTVQSTMATDPVTGRVLKIDVTLQVAK